MDLYLVIITIIRLFLSKKINNMDSKIDSNNNCDNTKKMEKVVKFIKKFIIWLSIWIGVALGFGYFNSIYCDSTDGLVIVGELILINRLMR